MVFEPINFMFSRAGWVAGGYLEGSVVAHLGTLYHADMQTVEEPGTGVEWSVLVPGGMVWRNKWAAGDYLQNDVLVDGDWTMVANKDTGDRPAPQPYGDPFQKYTGTIGEQITTAKRIIFGTRYSSVESGFLLSYRVYVIAGNNYDVWSVEDPLGTAIKTQLIQFTAVNSGWIENGLPGNLIPAGSVLDVVCAVNEPDPTPDVLGPWNWNYITPNNDSAPFTAQIIHANKALGLIRIHKSDDDLIDRGAQLLALQVGDIIDGVGQRWNIGSITDDGDYVTFGVDPAAQGSPDGVSAFQFETVTATPITYGFDFDYWFGDATGAGLYIADGIYDNIVPDDNAYGIDIEVQAATISPDWDVLARSEGGGSGGTFPRMYESIPLAANVPITEAGGPVQVTTLAISPAEVGKYRISIGIVADFTSAGDRLTWRTLGTFAGGNDFIIESKDALENVPVYLSVTRDVVGPFTITIEAEIIGPGNADVEISVADIYMTRIA